MTRGIVTKTTKISTPRKLPAIRYIEYSAVETFQQLVLVEEQNTKNFMTTVLALIIRTVKNNCYYGRSALIRT